ncbi:MAG: efflux RND transporter periplasmic adaptor subunit [Methyloceanibacter sp.]|uniref:efflux RND transporter periplasmic adaptor subunit n=1 Tax=Methyloceanibacter sp. TaxID=1965321 RepID=UPI003D6CE8AE
MNEHVQSEKVRADIEAVLGLDRPETRLRRFRPGLIVALVAAAALLLYFWLGTGGANNGIRYVTEPATKADLTVTVTATGTVQPTNQVEISSELSGIVRTVLVDYNSAVQEGQSLAELDTDKLKSAVDSSKAKLLAAKAKVSEAEATVLEKKLEHERQQMLVTKKVGAGQQLETAEAAHQRALAALESAKAETAAAAADLALHETDLSKALIRSPITGVVLSRNVEPGQTVASSLQAPILFTIAEDLTKMEVQVDVDEADVGSVKEGQKATFSVDAYPNRTFVAEIRELRFGSEVVQGVVTYKAVLTTDNTELLLRPGMTATAEIVAEQVNDAVTVPNAALRFSPPAGTGDVDDRNFLQKIMPGPPRFRKPSTQTATEGASRKVWVLSGGVPQEVSVTIGPSDGKRTQIVAGELQPGQAVIVDTAAGK